MAGSAVGLAAEQRKVDVVTFWTRQQFDEVSPGSKSALAVHFELEAGWHFYAYPDTAPAGMNIKVEPNEQGTKYLKFAEPILPKAELLYDPALEKKIDVFGGKLVIYLPFEVVADAPQPKTVILYIGIDGAVCSDIQCRVPDFGRLTTEVKIVEEADMSRPAFVLPQSQDHPSPPAGARDKSVNYPVWFALLLAFVAGLSLNIMPCVWPVLPIIVMRLVEQAQLGRKKSFLMGLAFCLGILLFFACLAGANIILQVFYGQVLQWGDQLRNPAFVTAMAVLLVALALFMFGLFTINVPSSLGGRTCESRGLVGAAGMGFLAAILSTPCSFGILAAAFAWAQTQPLGLATLTMLAIGAGMAAPYALLTSFPSLLKKTPKPGRWMELFKQTIGFVLLVIAVKLIAALPQDSRIGVLYFSLALSFCVWMWGGWVGFGTPSLRKWAVRFIAVALAVYAGFAFLPAPKPSLVDWQKYDSSTINTAIAENKPVLIKFTADWCLSCQVVEKTVYARRDIAELIKQKDVLAIKADTTLREYPATIALKEIYQEPGVPVSILLVPGQEPVRWRAVAFGDDLKTALEKLPSNAGK